MKVSGLILALLWMYSIGAAVINGIHFASLDSARMFARAARSDVACYLVGASVLPLLVIIPQAFAREGLLGAGTLGPWFDRRLGIGSYVRFMNWLKPELLIGCTCLATGFSELASVAWNDWPRGAVIPCVAMISGGAACVAAFAIARRRGIYR